MSNFTFYVNGVEFPISIYKTFGVRISDVTRQSIGDIKYDFMETRTGEVPINASGAYSPFDIAVEFIFNSPREYIDAATVQANSDEFATGILNLFSTSSVSNLKFSDMPEIYKVLPIGCKVTERRKTGATITLQLRCIDGVPYQSKYSLKGAYISTQSMSPLATWKAQAPAYIVLDIAEETSEIKITITDRNNPEYTTGTIWNRVMTIKDFANGTKFAAGDKLIINTKNRELTVNGSSQMVKIDIKSVFPYATPYTTGITIVPTNSGVSVPFVDTSYIEIERYR